MITRRDFIKGTGVGLGAMVLPTWLMFPEPATDIQKSFQFAESDGRFLHRIPGYDVYEIISYIWCSNGKKPDITSRKGREGLKYYFGRTVISGLALNPREFYGEMPYGKQKIAAEKKKGAAFFQEAIKETRDKLEELVKKELGNKNIWVLDKSGEMKLLKRI